MPLGSSSDVNSARGDVGSRGAVVRDDDGDRPGLLAIGKIVVGAGVLDPVVAVRVDLRDPRHPFGAQVAARRADCLRTNEVIPGSQHRVRNDDGHGDEGMVICGRPGIPRLVDAEPVEVRDALDTRLVLREQVEHGLPQSLRDTDGCRHAAFAWVDGPT